MPTTKTDPLLLAVRVLTYQGYSADAEPEIRPHVRAIGTRYRELKRGHSFTEAAELAKTEWLRKWLGEE